MGAGYFAVREFRGDMGSRIGLSWPLTLLCSGEVEWYAMGSGLFTWGWKVWGLTDCEVHPWGFGAVSCNERRSGDLHDSRSGERRYGISSLGSKSEAFQNRSLR